MLTQHGIVTAIEGDKAKVMRSDGICCVGGGGACACSAMAGSRKRVVTAMNRAGASKGDLVEVSISESGFLWAVVVIYLLPMILLLGGGIVGHGLHATFGLSAELASILGAMTGLLLGFVCSWALSRRAKRTKDTLPVIIRVLPRSHRQVDCELP